MRPAEYDFTLQRFGTNTLSFRLKNVDPEGAQTVISLAGCTVKWSASWPGGSLERSSANGQIALDPATGRVIWDVPQTDSGQMPDDGTRYIVVVKFPNGEVRPYLRGAFILEGY